MYSQYQTYQQNASVGVTTGQQWNGSQWVATPTGAAPSTYSTYNSTANSAGPATSSSLVTTYTQYYHQWHQRAVQQRKLAETLQGEQKAEALRQAQWADYYADQSSRAAHHYAGTRTQVTAPPIPPAPPQPQSTPQAQPVQQKPVQQKSTQKQDKNAPDGLKVYVHKCLNQCSTEQERQMVQSKVTEMISKTIQNGTMHTMDWANKELITVGNKPAASIEEKPCKKRKPQDYESKLPENDSYYGRGTEEKKAKRSEKKYDDKLPANDSYYGHANPISFLEEKTIKKKRSEKKYQDKLPVNDSYYGRAESTSSASSQSNHNIYGSYGPSSSFGDDDFVPIDFVSKKKNKKFSNKQDGFERSSSVLAKRANRFAKDSTPSSRAPSAKGASERYMGMAVIGGTKKLDETDYESMTVKGTCQTLEKEYLRLTAPPRAELVRPLPVLQKHLKNLEAEWKLLEKKHDYSWFCSQLKAMRQDLTVQRINNAFAVQAYEFHARIALEVSDLNEYNQCQTQLKELYDLLSSDQDALKNCNEFVAYRIIYYVFLTGNKKYEGGSSDLFKIMLSLTPSQRQDPAIQHALKVRVAVAEKDYHAFFRLQDSCPNLGAYLMDFMVPSIRHWALQRICKAYRPSVPVAHVLRELGFDQDETDKGREWLESCGCVLSQDLLQCKESVIRESESSNKTSLI